MTITQAFTLATKRVHLERFGRGQWVVNHWSPDHSSWWQGNPTGYERALPAYREALIEEALAALNVEDAACEAHFLAEESGPWRDIIRSYLAKQRAEK